MWQLRGKYPNRGYPKIFNDETVGEEAKKLHADAVAMLDEIVKNKTLKARGVVGIWPANATGDDIEVYSADGSGAQLGTFHTLRQQEEREDTTYYAMSDFIAPKSSARLTIRRLRRLVRLRLRGDLSESCASRTTTTRAS